MIPERKYTSVRIRNIALMVAAAAILVICFKLYFKLGIDEIIADFFIISVFFMSFIFVVTYNRIHGLIHENMSEKHTELMICFLICTIVTLVSAFLPEFTCPVLIMAVFLSLTSNVQIGMILGFFLDIIFCLNTHQNFFELVCYLILSMIGCAVMQQFREHKYRLYVNILVFSFSIIIPCVCNYFKYKDITIQLFLYCAVAGLISDLLLLIIFDRIYHITLNVEERSALEIIDQKFPLVQEIRKFSLSGYRHAVKVSELCFKCAKISNLNENIAAAAGFYYQLGRLEGEPFIDNGVQLAQLNCFPIQVISILYEYNGEKQLPGTPESALVHMIDAIVTRFEHMKEETSTSNWNRDLLIYQTMNDKSSAGLYDKSGLSINQYLKIREFLVRGDDL